ncbi:MAG: radical SAM family heme chaperone HemW [Anaerolineae bacterium]|jgi:oxygen-independent coproporphyrinogen-3 oxidase|nr:radical SAM family heme chaperone HemW [Anaerolineae bacterium]
MTKYTQGHPSSQVGLYVHVPFCVQRCTYCDFNTYTGLLSLEDEYVAAIVQEARLRAERAISARARTLYFGGGTPSLLALEDLESLVEAVRREFRLPWGAEVTLEANPGTLSPSYLDGLREAGVTRLSLGVQSSHSAELLLLGRIHTWRDAVGSYEAARSAGFDNISLDLMYGLPGQTLEQWQETVCRCLDLRPDHLSLYALTLEPGTPLAETLAMGDVPAPDPDLSADMYEAASELLHGACFWQYEISNWARGSSPAPEIWALPPGGETEAISPAVSAHNLIYWRNEPWVGLGAGAHSWFRGRRWSNLPHPQAYISAIWDGHLHGYSDTPLLQTTLDGELMMMGLRLAEGVSDARFHEASGHHLHELYGHVIDRFAEYDLLEWNGERVRLTRRGRLLGNLVFQEFLLPEE